MTRRIRRILNRLLQSIITLLGVSLLVFLITHAIPADPVAAVAGPKADAATRERIRQELGLNDPLWEQYGRYLGDVLHGDLGQSFVTGERVTDAILLRFPSTLLLSLGGVAIWLIVGVPLGVLTAKYRDKPIDWLTLVAGHDQHFAADVLAGPAVAVPIRLPQRRSARGGLLRVAESGPSLPHARRGRGRLLRPARPQQHGGSAQSGLHPGRPRPRPVGAGGAVKHALRNALIPVLTVLGLDIAGLLAGVVFTESIFALPGLGALALQAVLTLDVPMIMGTVMFAAVLVVGANIIVDLVYRLVDPRIQ